MGSCKLEIRQIDNIEDLNYLIDRVIHGPVFAEAFNFKDDKLKEQLLSFFKINLNVFKEKLFYYDSDQKLHISESENNYTWISTMGLIATKRYQNNYNQYMNSYTAQFHTLSLLLDNAILLCKEESVYNIDSYNYGYLNEITPALFHNILFFFEIFGKTYLSLNNVKITKTHELSKIYADVTDTMYKLNHNDTIFHAKILVPFEDIVKYISSIPGNFKEHFVKYNDNSEDFTVIRFDYDVFVNMQDTINMSYDFITSYYYDKENAIYLEQGLLQRLLAKTQNNEEAKKVQDTYAFLTKSL